MPTTDIPAADDAAGQTQDTPAGGGMSAGTKSQGRRPHHLASPLDPPCSRCKGVWQRPLVIIDDQATEYPVVAGCASCKMRLDDTTTVRVFVDDDDEIRMAPSRVPDDEAWLIPERLWARYVAASDLAHNLGAEIYALAARPTPAGQP